MQKRMSVQQLLLAYQGIDPNATISGDQVKKILSFSGDLL
jgi:hypothetical protein